MKSVKKTFATLNTICGEIGSANEIDYTTIECRHEGDCAGTCLASESQMRWDERQLRRRQTLGKVLVIAIVSMALTMAASAATTSPLASGKKLKHRQRALLEKQTEGYIQTARQELGLSDTIANVEDCSREVRTIDMSSRLLPHPDSIYTEVDVEAFYPDGDEAMDALIRDQLYIPDEILEPIKEINGTLKARCIVKTLVERDGTISDAVIEKTTTASIFDDEALRAVKNLPPFTPALLYGAKVRSWKLIPVEFIYDFSVAKQ